MSSAETVGEFDSLFVAADAKSRLYYKKKTISRIHFPATALRSSIFSTTANLGVGMP